MGHWGYAPQTWAERKPRFTHGLKLLFDAPLLFKDGTGVSQPFPRKRCSSCNKGNYGFAETGMADVFSQILPGLSTDFAEYDNCFSFIMISYHFDQIDEACPHKGIAANADAYGLTNTYGTQAVGDFIGQCAAARQDGYRT